MRIRKYDFDYSRRKMMANVAAGVGGGVLAPVWPTIAATGEVTKAYPDEVTSIEVNTKGKVKVGDTITAANVEYVKHLLDPIFVEQIAKHGRKVKIRAPTKNMTELFPQGIRNPWLEMPPPAARSPRRSMVGINDPEAPQLRVSGLLSNAAMTACASAGQI